MARPFGFTTWGYPAFMAAADLNGDGKAEIVTTHLFEAAVAVLRNTSLTLDEIRRLLKITGMSRLANGHVVLQCHGLPDRTVEIQAASNPNANSFVTIGSVRVDSSGTFQFEDSEAANAGKRFYRLTLP